MTYTPPTTLTPPRRAGGRGRTGLTLAATAAVLAGAALAARARAKRAERENPPAGRFIEVEGARLHYLERGTGSPIVLLHGNIVWSEDFAWSGLLDRLAEHHRVIAFDRPGYGHSTRPQGKLWTAAAQARLFAGAFAALGLERPVVAGHSWGASPALSLALDWPGSVGGLALLSGYYFPTARADVVMSSPPALPLVGDVMRYTVSPLLGAALIPGLIKGMFAPLPVPEHFKRHYSPAMSLRPWQIRASAQDSAGMIPGAAAMRPRYGSLRLPVAILAGTEDKISDVGRQAERLHHAIPHSSLTLLPGVGHMIHHADPDGVAEVIMEVADAAAIADVQTKTGGLSSERPPAALM